MRQYKPAEAYKAEHEKINRKFLLKAVLVTIGFAIAAVARYFV